MKPKRNKRNSSVTVTGMLRGTYAAGAERNKRNKGIYTRYGVTPRKAAVSLGFVISENLGVTVGFVTPVTPFWNFTQNPRQPSNEGRP